MTNQHLLVSARAAVADVGRLRALVIDESDLTRSVLAGILRQLGLPMVASARRPEEARRMIRSAPQPYDLIVSDFHFRQQGGDAMTGQDLLDELRQARGLPMQTAFIMVTDEARYQHVADALEGALDDYLLKPITAGQFEDRFRLVMERKAAFREVFRAIEAGEYEKAAQYRRLGHGLSHAGIPTASGCAACACPAKWPWRWPGGALMRRAPAWRPWLQS